MDKALLERINLLTNSLQLIELQRQKDRKAITAGLRAIASLSPDARAAVREQLAAEFSPEEVDGWLPPGPG